MKKYILSLDQGTTSSRAVLFDRNGFIVSSSQILIKQVFPKLGWVEHDPFEILNSQLNTITQAVYNYGISPDEIAAIGITNQRETTVVWNRQTGIPVYPAIIWQCRRTAAICDKLKEENLEPYIKEKTGLLIDAYFSATKIKWILDNVTGARELADQGDLIFGTIDSWIIWNLTGGRVHITDYTNASRTMLFDIDKLNWDPFLCEKFGIPLSMLPEVKPSSCVYGEVAQGVSGLEEFAGIPICSAVGDQQSALFGQACFEPGQAKSTYGSGCFLLMNTGKERVNSKNLVTTIAWGVGGNVEYALEGSAFNAGSAIKWLQDELGLISTPSECDRLAESVPDTDGIYFVPAFTGLGAPYWDMYARACVVGLTRGANRAHLARAVLESIAFETADLLRAMNKDSAIPLRELRVDGGVSVSDIMLQFQSDLLDIPVNRPRQIESTALGAAFLAGLAVNFWESKSQINSVREVDKIFLPSMPDIRRQELFAGWEKAVDRSRNWADK